MSKIPFMLPFNIADKLAMGDEDLVCFCMSVSRGEIRAAIRNGSTTLDALKSTLFCCTGCGTCEGRVRALLEESAAPSADQPADQESKKAG